jgi:hypothetical protein
MESDDLRRWLGAYLEVFEACGRGSENGFGRLLDYYDVPLLLGSDDGVLSLDVLPDGVAPVAVRGEPQEMRRIVLARLPGSLEGPAATVVDALIAASPAWTARARLRRGA